MPSWQMFLFQPVILTKFGGSIFTSPLPRQLRDDQLHRGDQLGHRVADLQRMHLLDRGEQDRHHLRRLLRPSPHSRGHHLLHPRQLNER